MNSSPVRVLFLGSADSATLAFLQEHGEDVRQTDAVLDPADMGSFDFLVSHGYRHLVRPAVLAAFPRRALNLHISYLPFNRGADPNFWSFVEGTPKGVTIHLIDEGLDTGEIVAQERVEFARDATLRQSYDVLQDKMLDLFRRTWPTIRLGDFVSHRQQGDGTSHRAADFAAIRDRLPEGFDTRVYLLPGVVT